MIKILFFITLVGFLLGQLARIQFPNAAAITFLDVSVCILVLYWVGTKLKNREKPKGKLLKPIIIFSAICLLSLMLNSYLLKPYELLIAFSYFVRWAVYALMYFVIRDQGSEFKKMIPTYLLFAIVAHLAIGFLQYFFYPDLKILFHLGWDDHLYRMFGSLLDPNFQGTLFVLFFSLLLGMLYSSKNLLNSKKKMVFIILTIITLLAVVLTFSRSALIMLFASLIVFGLFTKYSKLVLGFIGMTVLFVVLFSNVAIEGLNPFRIASTIARIEGMHEAANIIQKNPVIGVGFNAYRYAQYRYGMREPMPDIVSHADSGTDNSYLFILATTGVIGLIAYLYLLRNTFTVIQPAKSESFMRVVALMSLAGILVNCLFVNSLFYTFVMYWMWILIGITEST